jgi:hypothetical protein
MIIGTPKNTYIHAAQLIIKQCNIQLCDRAVDLKAIIDFVAEIETAASVGV